MDKIDGSTHPPEKLIKVPLAQIEVRDRHTQSRVAVRAETVAEYAAALQDAGDQFFRTGNEPVTLFHDGERYWIGDGWHRILAAVKLRTFAVIEARVRKGGQNEALLFAAGANLRHGLQRTNADKRKAVKIVFAHPTAQKWTDRKIATYAGVSHTFVSNMRAEDAASGNGCQIEREVERGGSTYVMQPRQRPAPALTPAPTRPAVDPLAHRVTKILTTLDGFFDLDFVNELLALAEESLTDAQRADIGDRLRDVVRVAGPFVAAARPAPPRAVETDAADPDLEEALADPEEALADAPRRRGRMPKPDVRWRCPACAVLLDEEPPSERECSSASCGAIFLAAAGEPTVCEECQRPFTRVLREYVHEDCDEEMEELEGYPCAVAQCPSQGFHVLPDVDPATEAQIADEEDEQKARALKRAAREAVKSVAWQTVAACDSLTALRVSTTEAP